MKTVADTIDASGYPLGFRVSPERARSNLVTSRSGKDVFRVEARAMKSHQKEAVVTEGAQGAAWRMVSDEGAALKGTDLAPFPLGFFNVGMQADLLNRLETCSVPMGVQLDSLDLELENFYGFSGSFFKGTGQGAAENPLLRIKIRSPNSGTDIDALVRAALRASPAMSAVHTALKNTFALYVNGKRCEVIGKHASTSPDAPDPFKVYSKPPHPLISADDMADIITKIPRVNGGEAEVVAASGDRSFSAQGRSRFVSGRGLTETETWLPRPGCSTFCLRSDERLASAVAPSGLAYQAAGIAFCYMTQLLRYTDYLKYKVSGIRIVQLSHYEITGNLEQGTLEGIAGPVDTHLFLNGDEPDDVMQKLLMMGANTCYLHAGLSTALSLNVSVELNGMALPFQPHL